MRKLTSIVLAMVLVFAMSCTAFAAESKQCVTEVTSAKDAEGNAVDIVVEAASTTISTEEAKDVLADDNVKVIGVQDVHVEGDAEDVQFPITLTFAVDGVKEGMTVYWFFPILVDFTVR